MRLGVALLVLACGCGEVQVRRTLPGDFSTEGVRYWLPAPYLVVKTPVQVYSTEELYQYISTPNTLTPPAVVPHKPVAGVTPSGPPTKDAMWQLIKDTPKAAPSTGNDGGESGQVPANNDSNTNSKNNKNKTDSNASNDPGTAPAATATSGLTIEWLPDYCQQYAIKQSAPGATSELALQFAQGWQLQTYNSKLDNTTLASKVIDAISSIVGDLTGGAAGKAAGGGKGGGGASDSSKQAAAARLLKKTTTWWLQPGVYPLYEYPYYDQAKGLMAAAKSHEELLHVERMLCSGIPQFSVKQLPLQKSESWSELALTAAPSSSGGAAQDK